MGVTDVFSKFLNRKEDEEANYLSLTLTSDKILAIIWKKDVQDGIIFQGYSEKDFHNIDSLIHEAAVAIDSAAKHISSDVNEVVFGLSNYWFEQGRPSNETADILKNMAQELELDAQAFVPLSASISHFRALRGNTKNGILIGAFKDYTEVSLVNEGASISEEHKGKAEADDIIRLIAKLQESNHNLPKSIVIFGENALHIKKELEKSKAAILEESEYETLTDEELASCVVYSQAADVLGHEPNLTNAVVKAGPGSDEKLVGEEQKADQNLKESEETHENEFEFKEGEDILEAKSSTNKEVNSDKHINKSDDEYAVEIEEKNHGYETPAQKLEESGEKTRSIINNLLALKWLEPLLKGSNKKKLLVPLVVIFLMLIAGVYILGYTVSSAQVLIKANSKPFEDDFDVTVASGAAMDSARSRIPGEETSVTVSDSAQTQVSGTKKIGNDAKGEVKVFNWTTSEADFDKGTVIISKNGIRFELDSDIEIASRSASAPGETKVSVTAQDFGTNGNVAAGTEFTLQQHDELLYSAKNDNAFTGGDEKEIKVVTKEDQEKLSESIEEALTQKAKDELKQKVGGQEIIDDAISIKILKKLYDHNIDDEATNLNLNIEIEASALSYSDQTLKELLSQFSQEKDVNLKSTADNIEILELDVTRNRDNLNLEGKYRANLIPNIDEENIKNIIVGKSQKAARELIKQNPEVTDVQFTFSPNLILFSALPKNKDKISIKIEANK